MTVISKVSDNIIEKKIWLFFFGNNELQYIAQCMWKSRLKHEVDGIQIPS